MPSHVAILTNQFIANDWVDITQEAKADYEAPLRLSARRPGYRASVKLSPTMKFIEGQVRSEDGATGQFATNLLDFLELVDLIK